MREHRRVLRNESGQSQGLDQKEYCRSCYAKVFRLYFEAMGNHRTLSRAVMVKFSFQKIYSGGYMKAGLVEEETKLEA